MMELVVDAIAEAAVEAAVERRRRRWLVGVVLEAMLGATRCTKKANYLAKRRKALLAPHPFPPRCASSSCALNAGIGFGADMNPVKSPKKHP